MAITVLEQVNELISNLTETLEQGKTELENCNPHNSKYLKAHIEQMQERLDFLISQKKDLLASGKTRYVYSFGTVEYFRQDFDGLNPDSMFILFCQGILDRETVPSKKVKYMENLMKAYREFKGKYD